jgi:hypothetical protein
MNRVVQRKIKRQDDYGEILTGITSYLLMFLGILSFLIMLFDLDYLGYYMGAGVTSIIASSLFHALKNIIKLLKQNQQQK